MSFHTTEYEHDLHNILGREVVDQVAKSLPHHHLYEGVGDKVGVAGIDVGGLDAGEGMRECLCRCVREGEHHMQRYAELFSNVREHRAAPDNQHARIRILLRKSRQRVPDTVVVVRVASTSCLAYVLADIRRLTSLC